MAKKTAEVPTTSIILPPELRVKLEKAAQESGARGIGAEIRKRLEASFGPEQSDELAEPKARELLDAIGFLSKNVTAYYRSWSQDRFAFDVLREAIDRILVQRFQPTGEAAAAPDELAEIVFGEGDHLKSAKDMGRMIAAIWLSSNPKREV